MPGEKGREPRLAALVEKSRAQDAIEALRAAGVYDRSRSVEAVDDDRVAIPVVAAPADTSAEEIPVAKESPVPKESPVLECRPVELPLRERGLEDVLAERGFAREDIGAAPSSWAVLGSVVLADFGDVSAASSLDADQRREVGDALLELHGNADTVLARGGVSGVRREPATEVVAGDGDTETVHVEYGTEYVLDLSRVMFSPGNKAERARMGEVAEPDEHVFDMFAGVGYFALPMARAGAEVTAAEIHPDAHRLLLAGTRRNEVEDRVHAIRGDCRDVDLERPADRIVMGHYDAHEYVDAALGALADSGTLHLHEATPEPQFPDRPVRRLTDAASSHDRSVEVLEPRIVKSHSAGVVHGVVDARLR